MNVVIIGAVALGPKVACRLKRLLPDAKVTMIDRDSLVSYGGCGNKQIRAQTYLIPAGEQPLSPYPAPDSAA